MERLRDCNAGLDNDLSNSDGCIANGNNDAHMLHVIKHAPTSLKQQQHEPEQPLEPDEGDVSDNNHHKLSERHLTATDLPPALPHLPHSHTSRQSTSPFAESNHNSAIEQKPTKLVPPPSEIRSAPARHSGTYAAATSRSDTSPHELSRDSKQLSVRSRLLSPIASPSLPQPPTRAARGAWQPAATTTSTNYGSSSSTSSSDGRARRHSILRFGSAPRRPLSSDGRSGMKKSASVEFTLHSDIDDSAAATSRLTPAPRSTGTFTHSHSVGATRDAPRRLTEQEKEELYLVRPDLEIGPSSFFEEQMAEQHRRNQQRVVFAMFGGLVTIVLLLMFYALFAQG